MAVDIDVFKSDLEQLKNQRSVIQAKLDEANRHITELTETLKGMGFNSVEEAKQAYQRQLTEAEGQHALVKQLIQEINQVDVNVPTREAVMERLNAMATQPTQPLPVNEVVATAPVASTGVNANQTVVSAPVLEQALTQPVQPSQQANDFIQQNIIPPATEAPVDSNNNGEVDLGGMLFASL